MRNLPKSPTPPTPPPPPPPLPTPALADADATLAADALAEVTLKPSPTPRRNMAFGGTRFEHGGSCRHTAAADATHEHDERRGDARPAADATRDTPLARAASSWRTAPSAASAVPEHPQASASAALLADEHIFVVVGSES